MNDKIDFVMIWVDGNDPEWRKEKDKYSNNVDNNTDNREARFRDWETYNIGSEELKNLLHG